MAKFKIRKNHLIGSPDAETDQFVLGAFVSIDNLGEILDTQNQKSILLGRTGSGKSAIIKYIKSNCDNVQEIAPEAMSLRFLSNSTILRYFDSLGVNLNLFYKVLWKHVFIVELLRMYFKNDNSDQKRKSIIQRIKERVLTEKKDLKRKEKAILYLETWSNDFWQQTELLIKTFERKIQESFATSIGIGFDKLTAGLDSKNCKDETFLFEAKRKAENVISNTQVVELIDVIDIMKDDFFNNSQKKFYLVIDDLDKDWIEDSLRLDLIGAMIDVIKEFRQLQGVKIIISLRENLNEIVYSKHEHKGSQREKLKPLYSNLVWTDEELKSLIEKRLKILSDEQLSIKDAFYEVRRGNKKGFDYILERTFYRPRDVISFINHMIENSNNKTYFTNDIISKAEPSYSIERFQALEDEWMENYGKISYICDFLRGITNGFRLKTVNETAFAEIFVEEAALDSFKGELLIATREWRNGNINYTGFQKKIFFILYRIGILGIKKGPTYPVAFYYTKEVIIEKNDISNNCKFYVHPSLYSYFKVNVLDQLPDDAD
ncbi:MAG: P-loop ATPase, Sll1717 family [Bacteroidota bacterium]